MRVLPLVALAAGSIAGSAPVTATAARPPAKPAQAPVGAAETPAGADRAIAVYRGLSREARVAWLEHLLRERTERAAGRIKSPQDQAALAAYHDEVLARVRAGQTLSNRGLEKLLGDARAMESAAIERLMADYRKAVGGAFAADAHARDLRLEAWRRVEASWRAAGRRDDDHSLLAHWLAEATGRIERGQTQHLPARPRFGVPGAEPATVASSAVAMSAFDGPPALDAPPKGDARTKGGITPNGGLATNRDRATKAAGPAPLPAPRASADAHGIDSRELDDRLSGYRVSLAGLNGHLQANAVSSAAELNRVVEELEEIVLRRGDLLLYVRLVSPEAEQTRLTSPATALSMVSSKISAARQRVETEPEKESNPRQELDRLADLSRRVANIAAQLQKQ